MFINCQFKWAKFSLSISGSEDKTNSGSGLAKRKPDLKLKAVTNCTDYKHKLRFDKLALNRGLVMFMA